jgi:hypothetical protein
MEFPICLETTWPPWSNVGPVEGMLELLADDMGDWPAELDEGTCVTPVCWMPLEDVVIPGRLFVSEIPRDLLPGMVEA